MATSYANVGGTGARQHLIQVSTANFSVHGRPPGLVDGTQNNDFWMSGGGSGETITFRFFIGPQIIDEAKWYQDTSDTHGVWQWQGSSDGSSFTNVGSTFTLGGSTTQTITALSGNTTAYEYWRLAKQSGSISSNPFDREIEFKIDAGPTEASNVQSYAHPGGSGDRSAIITVTSSSGPDRGTFNNLVDGAYGDTSSDSVAFGGGGTTETLKFDFGSGNARIVDEAAISGSNGNASCGTWKWQGSNDDSTYTDIGSTFTFQMDNSQGDAFTWLNCTTLHGNTTAYRYYKMVQTAGTTSFAPFFAETFFRIDAAASEEDLAATMAMGFSVAATLTVDLEISATMSMGFSEAATMSSSDVDLSASPAMGFSMAVTLTPDEDLSATASMGFAATATLTRERDLSASGGIGFSMSVSFAQPRRQPIICMTT